MAAYSPSKHWDSEEKLLKFYESSVEKLSMELDSLMKKMESYEPRVAHLEVMLSKVGATEASPSIYSRPEEMV